MLRSDDIAAAAITAIRTDPRSTLPLMPRRLRQYSMTTAPMTR